MPAWAAKTKVSMKPEEVTLYDILEVSAHASSLVIKAAYRCLTQANHPDKNAGNAGASARQALINHAYFVLSDPLRRQRYDRAVGSMQRFVERRGSDVPEPGRPSATAADPQHARAFAFRPLR